METLRSSSVLRKVAVLVGSTFLSGFLLFMSLPSAHPFFGEQWWMAWFAFVPLLIATREARFLVGFVVGLATVGFATFLTMQAALSLKMGGEPWWIVSSMMIYGVLFALTIGIYAERKTSELPVFWFACMALAIESLSFVQIPTQIAVTQYRNLAALQIANLGGIFLVSWLIWWFNFWVAQDFKRAKWLVGFIALCVFANFGFGGLSMRADRVRVALNQHDTSDENGLLYGQSKAAEAKADFAVWPEFGGILFQKGDDLSKLQELAKSTVPIITSYPEAGRARGGRPFNTARLFSASGSSEPYDKRKLFGGETRMHSAGTKPVTVPLANLKIGLSICYDSCFPSLVRDSARGADLIALPTIDPPSAGSFMAMQHAAFTPFRSAENGISIVRVDGMQSSMVTDPLGRIVREVRFPEQFAVANVTTARRSTLYSLIGDVVLYLSVGCVFLLPILRLVRKSGEMEKSEGDRLKEFVSKT